MRTAFGRTELPEEQEAHLRRAVRLAWLTIAFLVTAVTAVYLAMGSSQAMKAAWAEDLLSFIPPIAFLLAVHRTRKPPTSEHPYGYHRAVGIGHLVAATALLAMGAFLVFDSASSLVKAEHPPVGLIEIGGHVVWSGWLMIAVLAYTAVPPVLLGRAKMPLAKSLHDRVLYADADMNKADWMTAVGAIIGIVGIGLGLWWADAAAALFISGSILHDGVSNMRVAISALMDARAETYDGHDPHPLIGQIDERLREVPWVATARSRVRDQGHVFHVESFVVPVPGHTPTLAELTQARRAVVALDWKIEDMVLVPVEQLPERMLPSVAAEKAADPDRHDAGR
ncbi:cation diffusion facilitator family transporter [Georgenia satyanarayanai]|uniref:Cation diffusion facilitator family transporter n=1 Tax=Georgenia satyanarayanai TaxID=860221 RepID=A0A2Y9A709_9MICO|nr:cation diffusion facilitator family transporter [Georgenia satyanarayanai]PYG00939.1 cation diffusion facilitator family transporter [Georgenia satyanarayanai]SSA39178.1 cation diffusion facilitator family transporter [Georgenia satyanarayanai]